MDALDGAATAPEDHDIIAPVVPVMRPCGVARVRDVLDDDRG